MMTPAQIDQRNADFWAGAKMLRDQRLADPEVRNMAFELLRSQEKCGWDIRIRWSLEHALEKATGIETPYDRLENDCDAKAKRAAISEIGRRGGRRPKTDRLSLFLRKLIDSKPDLTEAEAKQALMNDHAVRGGTVSDHDEDHVYFLDNRGHLKNAPWSGLKDRLSRLRASSREALSAREAP